MRPSPLSLRCLLPGFFIAALLLTPALHAQPGASAAPPASQNPKKLLLVTLSMGFQHSSTKAAVQALQKLAQESRQFVITEVIGQPDFLVPNRPTPPRPLPKNPEKEPEEAEKFRFATELARYREERSKWTPEDERAVVEAEKKLESIAAEALLKLDPNNLTESQIDGVIFVGTSGNLPLPDVDGFLQWIEQGHAFIGIHSAADTLRAFPGYTKMLGAEFVTHGAQSGLSLELPDPSHPAAKGIPKSWRIPQEEFSRFTGYAPSEVQEILTSARTPKDQRVDADIPSHFPVAWVRPYGSAGRVFYTSLGHRVDLWDPSPTLPFRVNSPETTRVFHQHLLNGIHWALDLPAPAPIRPLVPPPSTPQAIPPAPKPAPAPAPAPKP